MPRAAGFRATWVRPNRRSRPCGGPPSETRPSHMRAGPDRDRDPVGAEAGGSSAKTRGHNARWHEKGPAGKPRRPLKHDYLAKVQAWQVRAALPGTVTLTLFDVPVSL